MRSSIALKKIRAGEVVKMCSLGHYMPFYVRHAAHFGFDCLWLEMEHRSWNETEIHAMIAYCHLHNIDCMVRTPTLEKSRLYRLLEDGASGIMIPHVSTPEKARLLVEAVKFPPIGDRGQDGAGLDNDYFLGGAADYPEQANRETFLVVQAETPQAIENADAIAAVPGVDAIFIGPGDLGLRLIRLTGHNLTLQKAVDKVANACAKHGKAWGMPVATPEEIELYSSQGAQILAHGGEFWAIMKMLEDSAANLDQNIRPRKSS
jgi:4-hydroxy-2-oxoheptanedioate aldolase